MSQKLPIHPAKPLVVVFQTGNLKAGHLGCVIPVPQPQGVVVGRVILKSSAFFVAHGAALDFQAQT
jgi:hypothetical protein